MCPQCCIGPPFDGATNADGLKVLKFESNADTGASGKHRVFVASFVNDARICGTNFWRDLTRI